jgi:hypothetical protein
LPIQATLCENISGIRFESLFNLVAFPGSNYAIMGRFRQGLGILACLLFKKPIFSTELPKLGAYFGLIPIHELKGHPYAS